MPYLPPPLPLENNLLFNKDLAVHLSFNFYSQLYNFFKLFLLPSMFFQHTQSESEIYHLCTNSKEEAERFLVAPCFYTNLTQQLVGQTKPEGAGGPSSHPGGGAEVCCCLTWFSSPDHLWKLLSQNIS